MKTRSLVKRLQTGAQIVAKKINKPTKKPHSYMEVLPYYCLISIFSYLTIEDKIKFEKFHKKWRELIWEGTKKLSFGSNYFHIQSTKDIYSQSMVKKIINNCQLYLTELTLDHPYTSGVMTAVKNCHNLTRLSMSLKYYEDKHLLTLLEKIKNLKFIEIQHYQSHRGNNRPEKFDTKIIESLPAGIQSINFSSSKPINMLTASKTFAKTLNKMKDLNSLTLSAWILDKQLVETVMKKEGLLSSLDLRWSNLRSGVDSLIFTSSKLDHLNLTFAHGVNSTCLISITMNCLNLRHLELRGCRNISIEAANTISNLKKLDYLDITSASSISDTLIYGLVANCQDLKYLGMGWCNEVSKLALRQLGGLKNIEELNLCGTLADDLTLIGKLHRVKSLDCCWCPGITDNAIFDLIQNAKNLEYLLIHGTRVTHCPLVLACTLKRTKKLSIHVNRNLERKFLDAVANFLEKQSEQLIIRYI